MSLEETSSTTRASFSRVRKHLEDAIVAQAEVCEKLKNSSQISSTSVSLVKYKAVLDEIEAERAAHARTKAELKRTQDQLELAHGEVEVLQKQLAREKVQFEKTFSLINKKTVCDKVKKGNFSGSENNCQVTRILIITTAKDRLGQGRSDSNFSGSENNCQVSGSVSDDYDPEVNVKQSGVNGTEKRLTARDSVRNKKTSESSSKGDNELNELDISASSEEEINEQKAVFIDRSSASLHSNIQNSLKNARFQTRGSATCSRSCGHEDFVRTTFGKPNTKLKSNAKKITKR